MGVPDYVNIPAQLLPGDMKRYLTGIDFQTKSLTNSSDTYLISDDYKLIRRADDMNELTDDEFCEDFTGEIRMKKDNYELVAWCVDGKVKEIVQIIN